MVEVIFKPRYGFFLPGSIRWWSRGHRAHHRWTDTDKDPYAATRGFFFSHMGWMLINRPKSRIGYADVADLKSDKLIRFQHAYYPWFALTMGFLFPCLVAGLGWGDYKVSNPKKRACVCVD